MRIYPSDLEGIKWGTRRGYCAWGIEYFFSKYGLDLADFEKNGIEEEILRATGNEFALKAIKAAYERRR